MLLIIDPSLRDLDLILSSRQPALLYNSSTATVTLATCATDAKAEATMQAKNMLASSHPIYFYCYAGNKLPKHKYEYESTQMAIKTHYQSH